MASKRALSADAPRCARGGVTLTERLLRPHPLRRRARVGDEGGLPPVVEAACTRAPALRELRADAGRLLGVRACCEWEGLGLT